MIVRQRQVAAQKVELVGTRSQHAHVLQNDVCAIIAWREAFGKRHVLNEPEKVVHLLVRLQGLRIFAVLVTYLGGMKVAVGRAVRA